MEESPDSTAVTPDLVLDRDLTREQYRGPGAAAAGIGAGAIRHTLWALIGITVGGGLAYLAPQRAAKFIESSRESATRLVEANTPEQTSSWAKRKWGGLVLNLFGEGDRVQCLEIRPHNVSHDKWLNKTLANKKHGFGFWFLSHIIGSLPGIGDGVQRWLIDASAAESPRLANAITAGGILGASGYLTGSLTGITHGGKQGYEGRSQHSELVTRLKDVRDERDQLMARLDDIESLATESPAKPGPNLTQANDKDTDHHAAHPQSTHEAHAAEAHSAHATHAASHPAHHESQSTIDASSVQHHQLHAPHPAHPTIH